MKKKRADNTEAAYGSAWKLFTGWCLEKGFRPRPASFDAVSCYITHLVGQGLRNSTIRTKLSGIAHHHETAGYASPVDYRIREMLSNIARTRRERKQFKTPVTLEQVKNVIAKNRADTPKGARDRAMFALLFALGWRRSELRSLDLSDLAFPEGEGVTLSLGASKADQAGKGREVSIPFSNNQNVCPVRLLQKWIERRGAWPGPLFCGTDRHGHILRGRLGGRAICCIVQDMLKGSGVTDAKSYGAHSLRSGMITTAHLHGASHKAIMNSTGHMSAATVWNYVRGLDGFRHYPLKGVL